MDLEKILSGVLKKKKKPWKALLAAIKPRVENSNPYNQSINLINPLPQDSRLLTTLTERSFENIMGKGENAGNQHFLLFPKCFLPVLKQISIFESHLFCCCKGFEFGPV